MKLLSNSARLFWWAHALAVAGFYLVAWLRTREQGSPPTETKPAPLAQKDPWVSIIVPARNEERNITRCLASLLAQDYPAYDILVVDDGSTDDTAVIVEQIAQTHPQGKRLHMLHLHDLPDDWAGKPHALHMGSQQTQGDFLLFTDADTWHAPETLRMTVSRAEKGHIDLFTLGTTQELPTFWERVTMPMAFMGISMQYPLNKVNDPLSPLAIANGQYLLMRRSVYEEIGGYARAELRKTLLDDLDLARVVKREGFALEIVDGRDYVRVRMYQSLREIWRGWCKNIFLGSRGGLFFTFIQIVGLPTITVLPFFAPLWFWLSPRTRKNSTEASALSFLELGPLLAYRLWLNKEFKIPWYFVLTHPLAGLIFTGLLAQSSWRVLTRRGVEWRGRIYTTQKIHRK